MQRFGVEHGGGAWLSPAWVPPWALSSGVGSGTWQQEDGVWVAREQFGFGSSEGAAAPRTEHGAVFIQNLLRFQLPTSIMGIPFGPGMFWGGFGVSSSCQPFTKHPVPCWWVLGFWGMYRASQGCVKEGRKESAVSPPR